MRASEARAAAVGAVVFIIGQVALVPATASGVRWFLNTGTGVAMTLALLGLGAFVLELVERTHSQVRPLWTAAGAIVAMIVYLFAIGPGNLFPIVVMIGSATMVPAVVFSGFAGAKFRTFLKTVLRRD